MTETDGIPPEPGTVPDTELGWHAPVEASLEPPENDQELGDNETDVTEDEEDA